MKKSNPVLAYFVSSFEELRRVTWPTKEQTARLTIIVVIFSLLVAVFLGAVDLGFTEAFTRLISLF
ncbi:MAG: preprotein translocase subunit SecE [Candidatus Gracilibacteria bacterium]